MNKRTLLQAALVLATVSTFSAGAQAQEKPLKIGVTAGPHAQIFEQVKKVAAKDGLKIQIVEFSDYVQPNAALAAGDQAGGRPQGHAAGRDRKSEEDHVRRSRCSATAAHAGRSRRLGRQHQRDGPAGILSLAKKI